MNQTSTQKHIKEEMTRELHLIAVEDAAASKVLYENKKYPQAIFLLQQSIEKCSKAMDLHLGLIKLHHLRNLGHGPSRTKDKLLNKQKAKIRQVEKGFKKHVGKQKVPAILEELGSFHQLTLEGESVLQELQDFPLTVGVFEELDAKLDDFLRDMNQLNPDDVDSDDILKSMIVQEILGLVEGANKAQVEKELASVKEKIPLLIKHMKQQTSVMIVQAIATFLQKKTEPHSVASRYPDHEERHLPTNVYTEQHELIMYFLQLHKLTERFLTMTETILQNQS